MNVLKLILINLLNCVLSEDLYNILGVDKKATIIEIKRAFREKDRIYHPDKNKDKLEWARKEFNKISQAYEVLSNHMKRDQYDNDVYSSSDGWYSSFDEFFKSYNIESNFWEEGDDELWDEVIEAYVEIKNFLTEKINYYKNTFKNWYDQALLWI